MSGSVTGPPAQGGIVKVLVTGSSGFVGSALVERLRASGHDVRGFSRTAAAGTFAGDLLDPASIAAALDAFKPELIFNLAGKTDLKGAAGGDYRVNVDGVSNLIDAAADAQSVRRIVWASTQLVNRPGRTVRSDTDFDPADDYGRSKVAAEQHIRARDGGGKEWVTFRSTTIWGPGMSDHYLNVIRMIRRGRYVHLGWRPLRKSYSYVDNLAAQLETLGTAPASAVHGKVFYLADSEPVELRAWHNAFAAAFDRRLRTIPILAGRLLGLVGDVVAAAGVRAPITSRRVRNMLTEYVHDVAPIEALHGATAISNAEAVRRTAAWLTAREPLPHAQGRA